MHYKILIFSIRTQANIKLLDEKINLIGSLKAHREHCQRLETTLQNLEEQANNLPQIPPDMISTIHDLKKDVLFTFHFPSQNSEYDLSCDCDDVDNDIKSNIRYDQKKLHIKYSKDFTILFLF